MCALTRDPGQSMRVFDFNAAIVRLPGQSVVEGLRAHAGPPPTFDRILAEHQAYVRALRDAGVRVTVLPPLEAFPDSVFVEDPALVFGDAAVLLRPGATSRLAEAQELSPTLAARFPRVLQLRDGFADGGDVLVTPDRVFIGLSSRTDRAGAAALQDLLESTGRASEIVVTPSGTLHLKSDCSLIDEETVLATSAIASSGELRSLRTLVVPEEERGAANALRVNDVVFVGAGWPRTQELLGKHGLTVVSLPTSEIAKIDAGLSCMSLRWLDPVSRTSPVAG
jgi:dimethylargininase